MKENYQMSIYDIIGDERINEIKVEYQTVK